jgi:hypothetical protein
MLVGGGAVAITNKTSTTLVDELAALELAGRRELAAALRGVAETLAEVPDAKTASHVLGVSVEHSASAGPPCTATWPRAPTT